jgi:hypothetical protein
MVCKDLKYGNLYVRRKNNDPCPFMEKPVSAYSAYASPRHHSVDKHRVRRDELCITKVYTEYTIYTVLNSRKSKRETPALPEAIEKVRHNTEIPAASWAKIRCGHAPPELAQA